MAEQAIRRYRVQSIDILRGLVMVIMALDHVRDFFFKAVLDNASNAALDPTNMQTTFPALFFTRWITHFCAPVFVFLAGTSIYLIAQKKSKNELSAFLFKRGLWLVIVEVVIISLGWTFNPLYNVIILQVIWAIGISMILMSLLVQLPYKVILILGLLILLCHNLLDIPEARNELDKGFLADLLYFSQFDFYSYLPNRGILIVYAFLPWTALMMVGYCFGKLYKPSMDPGRRKKILVGLGLGITASFIVLRLTNVYGDPVPWQSQPRGPVYTFLSFLNANKYPPSLVFLSMTLGPAILLLAFLENIKNRVTDFFNVYGRVPMFYYILHFFIIHVLVVIVFYLSGYGASDIVSPNNPFLFRPNDFGFNLWGVYAVWIFVVLVLYPLCKKYDRYKSTHKDWWLSYL
jgi:uncharacterized membrane protein